MVSHNYHMASHKYVFLILVACDRKITHYWLFSTMLCMLYSAKPYSRIKYKLNV